MRLKLSNRPFAWLIVSLLAAGPAAGQSASDRPELKHYGYSGQDKLLDCMQKVFGKYAASFPDTVLYGYPSTVRDRPPQVVDGHWEPATEHITYPPVAELACPNTREKIVNLLQNEVSKLLFVPQGELEGIRLFETPQWVYIIPASLFSDNEQGRQKWTRVKIEPKIEAREGISIEEARSLVPEILRYARIIPLSPPVQEPNAEGEIEIDFRLVFYKRKLAPNAPDSIITVIDQLPWAPLPWLPILGRLTYGEIHDGRYQFLWDSPLYNGNGLVGFKDVNGDGREEIFFRSLTCGRWCFPELVVFDRDGRELTRQRKCKPTIDTGYHEDFFVCAINGRAVEFSLSRNEHQPKNVDIQVESWGGDRKDHIFRLVDGLYVSGSPLSNLKHSSSKAVDAPSVK